jgi:hypothetical protein
MAAHPRWWTRYIFNALLLYGYQLKELAMNNSKKKVTLLLMQYGGTSKMADQIFLMHFFNMGIK